MIAIRPVWTPLLHGRGELPAQVLALLDVEERIVKASAVFVKIARVIADEEYIDELASLMRSAQRDLAAGCEMARTGYIKQAYSLWRSWFEQSIFFLYFLEAPLHKAAWKVKAEVSQDDSPQYRLMLHQLLADSSEKHPFTLVYDARFTSLIAALKISAVPKAQRPIQRAIRVLTVLSQGVHGTYQPQSAENMDYLCTQLDSHCRPVLQSAEDVVNTLWMLLITDSIALPEEVLIKLREGSVTASYLSEAGIYEADSMAEIAPFFSRVFPSPQEKHG